MTYRQGKALDKDLRYYLKVEMLQQDIIGVIFEFTATLSFHRRYININTAKFKNSKRQKVM